MGSEGAWRSRSHARGAVGWLVDGMGLPSVAHRSSGGTGPSTRWNGILDARNGRVAMGAPPRRARVLDPEGEVASVVRR